MKKLICKVEYDTETAELIKKRAHGAFGDPAGYEETLYRTKGGLYFVLGTGGEASPYPAQDIRPLTAVEAKQF